MNIYVGNLSYGMSEDELRDAFGAFGAVSSVKILMDRETGRSRGFGFVEMPNNGEAETAIAQLNGKDLGGRPLRINEARPREQREAREQRRSDLAVTSSGGSTTRDPTGVASLREVVCHTQRGPSASVDLHPNRALCRRCGGSQRHAAIIEPLPLQ